MTTILAEVPPAAGSFLLADTDWSTRFWVLALVGLLLLCAVLVAAVERWRKHAGRLGPSADEELAQYREMYQRGELSTEEFQRLRAVLGGRIRARLGTKKHPEVENPPMEPPANGRKASETD